MGFKKIATRSYCEEDSAGYRISCVRNGRVASRKLAPNPSDAHHRVDSSMNGRTKLQYSRGESLTGHDVVGMRSYKKKVKNSMRDRNKQRREKYEDSSPIVVDDISVSTSSDSIGNDVSLEKISDRNPSPLKTYLTNHRAQSRALITMKLASDDCMQRFSNRASSHHFASGSSSMHVDDAIRDMEDTSLAAATDVIVDDRLISSLLSRCGEVLYALLYPNANRPLNRYAYDWDDADSDDETSDMMMKVRIVSKAWFVQMVLDLTRGKAYAMNVVHDIIHMAGHVDQPYKLLTAITSSFVASQFLELSSFFLSACFNEIMSSDDRQQNADRITVLQAAYQQCSYMTQRRILLSIYESLSQHLDHSNYHTSTSMHDDHIRQKSYDPRLHHRENTASISSTICSIISYRLPYVINTYSYNTTSILPLILFILAFESSQSYSSPPSASLPSAKIIDRELRISFKVDLLIKVMMKLFRSYGHHHLPGDQKDMYPDMMIGLKAYLQQFILWMQSQPNACACVHLNLLLRELLRYWPRSSYSQELLFIDAMVMILSAYHIQPGDTTCQQPSSDVILCLPLIMSSVERSVRRLLSMLTSSHHKVAHRLTLIFQSRIIMEKYFLIRDEDNMVIRHMKGDFMDKLIINLNENLTHWHPMVQAIARETIKIVS